MDVTQVVISSFFLLVIIVVIYKAILKPIYRLFVPEKCMYRVSITVNGEFRRLEFIGLEDRDKFVKDSLELVKIELINEMDDFDSELDVVEIQSIMRLHSA